MDILDAAKLLRFQTDWERRFHEYDLLLTAGIDADEAERIVRRAAADRAALQQEGIAA
ncbi:hypothetical protein LB579_34055 [Mesorhizobium sp. BR1-1-7]|uniref:hypothetical protein n=1 Tax=Mesorhizobium sp. BR1-1-7 TaxID=2876647 RepID=UPI001CCB3E23|nr:hypothetical protein [Mesorhizobium sp. BR1-1-7]MBZ9922683.1 hypothetical protein [Mesorhizobium sp. BR1-1-7]